MKRNFRCPLCGKYESMGKKLHGSWTCPNCKHTIIPTAEIKQSGKMSQSYLNSIYALRKKYKKENFFKKYI